MVVEEPDTTGGLWDAVKARTGWPDTNEDGVAELAAAWKKPAASFLRGGAVSDQDISVDWPDDAGKTYHATATALRGQAFNAANEMSALSGLADKFAGDVRTAKTSIRDMVNGHIFAYLHLTNFFGFPDEDAKKKMVDDMVNAINTYLDQMETHIATRGGGAENQTPTLSPHLPGEEDHLLSVNVSGNIFGVQGTASAGIGFVNGKLTVFETLGKATSTDPIPSVSASVGSVSTNATDPQQLAGPFDVAGVNASGGGATVGVDHASGGGVYADDTHAGISSSPGSLPSIPLEVHKGDSDTWVQTPFD